ncbi:MAG: NADH-quinone oxidoreductase subunit NuoE [Chloroflexi bacterium]|nr:NADH-quinone oxidoreductase subunit NuoE [Chloroflexota bacterium]
MDTAGLAASLSQYRGQRGAAVPALEAVQARYGYVPYQALVVVAETLGVLPAEVFGVASFYEEFRFAPPGAHVIAVCTGTSCHLAGAQQLLAALEGELGIKTGQTTADGQFTLTQVSCPGPCAIGPVLMMDGEPQARVTPDAARRMLATLRSARSAQG